MADDKQTESAPTSDPAVGCSALLACVESDLAPIKAQLIALSEKYRNGGEDRIGWEILQSVRALDEATYLAGQGCLGSFVSSTGSDATIKRLLAVLDGLIQECEYSATNELPFNFPEGKGRWTQLENAKALLANLRQNDKAQ